MRRYIENPRIILLDCPLEYKKGESQTNIEILGEQVGIALCCFKLLAGLFMKVYLKQSDFLYSYSINSQNTCVADNICMTSSMYRQVCLSWLGRSD